MLTRSLVVALAFAAGALTVFAFAPFSAALVAPASLALLFIVWSAATTPRRAAALGFAWGLGLFGFGASWVFIALETFGGMPLPVAVIATAGFVAYLALWPALAGWVAARVAPPGSLTRSFAAAGAFVIGEWLRGYVFTGFPWLTLGYAALPGSGALPLAGFAPVGGVFLTSLAVALTAAAIAGFVQALATYQRTRMVALVALAAALVAAGALLRTIDWTHPVGTPLAVSLVQSNVAQEQKFDPAFQPQNYALHADLVRRSRGRVVVLPESAYAQFADEIPAAVLENLATLARERDGMVLAGLFVLLPPATPGADERIHNSVVSLSADPPQLYRKHHLVPFGESIPLKAIFGWFINSVLHIPLADQAAGPALQAPFAVAGQRLAVDICYEDAFGGELAVAARGATILVNVTNDAWYGRSIAARQHNQIAAMRALETGRPMLRATNSGITSAIGPDGRVLAQLPWFTRDVLEVEVTGRGGSTPYMRVGDALALVLAAAVFAGAALAARRCPAP
ncbi:MAG: apolipoprotein N-acyltransferase [Burkholderiales bacterium]|nr:apolipoprotein N-acyltransferase [Burkholderiales bacterium]